MLKDIKIDLMYQPMIDKPPAMVGDIYKQACKGDKLTIDSWRDTWLKNYQSAKDKFGEFATKSYGNLYGINRHKPCIVIGSGPSLKDALPALKENAARKYPVMTVSCLHNFGLFEDEGINIDYYLSLDSGGVVIDDVSESRNEDGGFYWDATKDHKLLAYVASDPKLWDLWQGELFLFNSLIPDNTMREEFKKIEPFSHYISSGGNAGGACFYTAKAVFAADPVIFVGFDSCFGYDNTFHSYSTKYDNLGEYMQWPDVYGVPRKTWASYLNFKFWLDDRAMKIPGTYINCSEGLLGAYKEGNLKHFKYMSLADAMITYYSSETLYLEKKNHKDGLLEKEPFSVEDYYSNPNYEHDVVFF
jgi:hypothetical protein